MSKLYLHCCIKTNSAENEQTIFTLLHHDTFYKQMKKQCSHSCTMLSSAEMNKHYSHCCVMLNSTEK